MSKRLPFAGLLAAGLVAALTACGPGQQAHAAAQASASPVHVYHQFAQCVRDHGDPSFPDPAVDAQGRPQLPSNVQRPPDQVLRACESILNQLPQSLRPTDHPDPAMMRRFAQCMRAHGITDWPDPDSQGRFPLPPSLANLKQSPRFPQIRAVWEGPCKQYDTSGHIEVAPS